MFAVSRFSLTRVALAAALALGAVPFAQAQSLQELYDAARGFDATYLAARSLADSAQYKAAQLHALRRPKVDAIVGAARNTNDPTFNGNDTSDTTTKATDAKLVVAQSLFNRANDASISQADLSEEAAKADLQIAEQELIVRVAQSYFDVLAAQDALTTAQANKKAISEQLASAKRNFEVGTTTITDTREAQARFDLATAQEIAADNDLLTKRIALDQLVGRTGVQPKPLAVPVVLPPVAPANVEEWVGQTDSAPSVRKAKIGYDVAQLETSKARAGHLPTLGLSASYGRSRTDTSGQSLQLGSIGKANVNQSSVGVQLTIPLFAGFSVQNRVKETLSLEEQSRNILEAARRSVAQATRQTFFGVQSQQARVKALEAAESSNQLALDAIQLGYKVGVRVNLDVLNAQTQLYNARSDLAKARYDVLVNSLRLRQASGQLKPEDLTALNALLAK